MAKAMKHRRQLRCVPRLVIVIFSPKFQFLTFLKLGGLLSTIANRSFSPENYYKTHCSYSITEHESKQEISKSRCGHTFKIHRTGESDAGCPSEHLCCQLP